MTVYDVLDEKLDENSSEVIIFTEFCRGIDLQKELEKRQETGQYWDIKVLERFAFDIITVFKIVQER